MPDDPDGEPVNVWPTMARLRRRLRQISRDERGFTLTELTVTMAIMGIVIAAVVTLFTSGSNAEVELNLRFQSQSEARLALDSFRREVHNACSATVTGGTTVQLKTLTSTYACSTASATWCTSGSGTRYKLYRQTGATCSSSGVLKADYLTGSSVFAVATATNLLPKVSIDLTVNRKPSVSRLAYRLQDSIALRNGTRG